MSSINHLSVWYSHRTIHNTVFRQSTCACVYCMRLRAVSVERRKEVEGEENIMPYVVCICARVGLKSGCVTSSEDIPRGKSNVFKKTPLLARPFEASPHDMNTNWISFNNSIGGSHGMRRSTFSSLDSRYSCAVNSTHASVQVLKVQSKLSHHVRCIVRVSYLTKLQIIPNWIETILHKTGSFGFHATTVQTNIYLNQCLCPFSLPARRLQS
jgi:hypothetical protein